LKGGTASLSKEADRSLCSDGTSVTLVKCDDRYAGALPFSSIQHRTAVITGAVHRQKKRLALLIVCHYWQQ